MHTMTPPATSSGAEAPDSRRVRRSVAARAALARSAVSARQHALIAGIAFLGLAIMLYPATASWISALQERGALQSYAETLEQYSPQQREAALREAERYNAELSGGLIVDPFSNTSEQGTPKLDAHAEDYLSQLALDPDDVMARVRVPGIGVDLPVYHGATDEVLRKGAGHLYGSSLPVGGADTHAVLTAHSGLPEAELFTHLEDLAAGDLFQVETLGRLMTYEVTSIEVVEPTEIENLAVVEGEDLVTLVTCTPTGVNSHRLLVQGERVPNPPGAENDRDAVPAIPFPWLLLLLALALVAWGGIVTRAVRLRGRLREAGQDGDAVPAGL